MTSVQLTCGHFKEANKWLQARYGDEGIIDWNLGPVVVSKPAVTTTEDSTPVSAEETNLMEQLADDSNDTDDEGV